MYLPYLQNVKEWYNLRVNYFEDILWQKLETPDARMPMYDVSQKENIPRALVT